MEIVFEVACMESFVNDVINFFKEVFNIPPEALATYSRVNMHPFSFFNNQALDWDFHYFGAGLALAAFLFCYITPVQEYSGSLLVKWLSYLE